MTQQISILHISDLHRDPGNPLYPSVSPITPLHTKTNVILDVWRSWNGLSSLLRMRKKESTKPLFTVMEATETADVRLIHRHLFRPEQSAYRVVLGLDVEEAGIGSRIDECDSRSQSEVVDHGARGRGISPENHIPVGGPLLSPQGVGATEPK